MAHRRQFIARTLWTMGALAVTRLPRLALADNGDAWDLAAADIAHHLVGFLEGEPVDIARIVISRMLGGSGSSHVLDLTRASLPDIGQLLDDRLRQDDFNRTIEDFAGVGEIFRQYHTTPGDLKDVIDRTTLILGHLQALPAYALPTFTLAASLKLSAQCLYHDAVAASLANVRDTASDAEAYLRGRLQTLSGTVHKRFGPIRLRDPHARPGLSHLTRLWHASFTFDGTVQWQGHFFTEAQALRTAETALDSQVSAFLTREFVPFRNRFVPICAAWSQIAV